MVRVGLYLRVSKDKKGGVSIDVQREVCLEHIARMPGWALVRTYTDDGKSAYTDDMAKRPQFQQLLRDAAARQFDVILVYKYDRFARKRRVYFQQIDELKERYNVEVKSATESDDWLSVGFNGLMAEQYSRMLSARMTDVRRWEITHEKLHAGRVPVGYTRTRGLLTPSEEADAIRRLGQLYASGAYSHVQLAETLNAEGYRMPNGALFKPTAIKDMLSCPVYAGLLIYRGNTFPGQHEALWDADLWRQIQAVRARRTYTRGPERDHQALLTGIVTCARCGASMGHHPQTRNPACRYYRCAASTKHQLSPLGFVCTARCGYADALEAQVLDWLYGLALLPSLIDEALREIEQPVTLSRTLIEQRLARLARAYGDGAYTDEEYTERRTALLVQLTPTPHAVDRDAIGSLLRDLPSLIDEATAAERRAIVGQLLTQVYAWRGDVLALRPTRAAEVFFQVADVDRWLTIVRTGVRSASNAVTPHWLKVPVILDAA